MTTRPPITDGHRFEYVHRQHDDVRVHVYRYRRGAAYAALVGPRERYDCVEVHTEQQRDAIVHILVRDRMLSALAARRLH